MKKMLYPNYYRKITKSPWESWFAWYPVVMHNKHIWLKTVYRRRIAGYYEMHEIKYYEYGTIFDVINEGDDNE